MSAALGVELEAGLWGWVGARRCWSGVAGHLRCAADRTHSLPGAQPGFGVDDNPDNSLLFLLTGLSTHGAWLTSDMVGVLSEIARVLKEASISIFTISTW